jgi:hypothetical protein
VSHDLLVNWPERSVWDSRFDYTVDHAIARAMRVTVDLTGVFGVHADNDAELDPPMHFCGVERDFEVVTRPVDGGRAGRPARRVFEKVFMVIVVFRRSRGCEGIRL